MKEQHKGLNYSYYDMSDLENVFSLRHLDSFAKSRDYGTGGRYTTLEAHTITLIEQNPGITVTEIAKIFNRTKSSVSQLVSRLEKKGLVMKTRQDGEDQKIRHLFVTKSGRELSIAHVAFDEGRYQTYVDRLLEYFTLDEINIGYRFLDVIMNKNIKGISGPLKKNDDNWC